MGLGASAGGLAALTTCFEQLPGKPDMASVVILHLSPSTTAMRRRSCSGPPRCCLPSAKGRHPHRLRRRRPGPARTASSPRAGSNGNRLPACRGASA
ncbi:MAG: chemotaxis protein CheB [Burkholderiaceae bacterium]